MKQESDVIALIDLAQACVLFTGQNYKAAGVCYNNIANLHYKNGKYQLAADSYNKAVHMAEVCLGTLKPSDFYDIFKEEKPLVEEERSKQGGKEDAVGNSQSECQLTAEQKLHF